MTPRMYVPTRFGTSASGSTVGLQTMGRSCTLSFEDASYNSPRHNAEIVERVGNFPSFLRLQPGGKTIILRFVIKSEAIQEQFNAIARIFNPTLGESVLTLEDRSCRPVREYQISCAPQQLIHDRGNPREVAVVLFASGGVIFDVDEISQSDTIVPATNPITINIQNDGSYPSLPAFTIPSPSLIKLPAEGYVKMREIAYANRSEFSLTSPGSGTWMLQIIDGWDTAAIVAAGDMESDGKDVSVWVDEIELPPEKISLVDINTNNSEVWIEISDGPSVFGELAVAIIAGTTTFQFIRKDHGIREHDFITWIDDASLNEQAFVTSVSQEFVTVIRGVRNSDAIGGVPGPSAIGTKIYRSGHHIQLAWDRSGLSSRPTNPDPPLIDLGLSLNTEWHWPTAPLWSEADERRAGGYRRILYNGRDDVPGLRKNRLSARTSLEISGVFTRWTDQDPTPGAPNFDAIEFTACCGAVTIEHDASVPWPFAFQIIGRDMLGYDTVVANRLGHEGPGSAHQFPFPYTNEVETPSDTLSAVILRARNITVTSARPSDTFDTDLDSAGVAGQDSQKFKLDEETQITGIIVRAKDDDNPNGTLLVDLREVSQEDVSLVVSGGPGEIIVGPFTGFVNIGAAMRESCFFPLPGAAFTTEVPSLSAGDYFVAIYEQSGDDILIPHSSTTNMYAKGSHWERNASGVWERDPDDDLWFAIISLNADNQEELLGIAGSGEQLDIDQLKIAFDNSTPRTPLLRPAVQEDAYHYDSTFSLDQDTIRFRYLKGMTRTANVIINVSTESVQDFEHGLTEPFNIRQSIEVIDDPWIEVKPGPNVLTVTAENGAQDEDHTVNHRDSWLA